MCCPLDKAPGVFKLQTIEESSHHHPGKCSHKHLIIKGTLDHTPLTFADRATRFFQRLEMMEKVAEVVDETFHLFHPALRKYASLEIFQFLQNFHDGAHHIEHALHSFCFMGDVVRIANGKFIEKAPNQKTDYARTAARVIHTVSHLLATAELLDDLKICSSPSLKPLIRFKGALSAFAYGIWTASLLWRYYQTKNRDTLASDLSIHAGGALFEGLTFLKRAKVLTRFTGSVVKAAAITGIIHAWNVAERLMPEKESIRIKLDGNRVGLIN
jgi:hypothetical protein